MKRGMVSRLDPQVFELITQTSLAVEEALFLSATAPRRVHSGSMVRQMTRLGEIACQTTDLILATAHNASAPDVHLTLATDLHVSLRLNGLLVQVIQIPRPLGETVIGRVKVLAGLPVFQSQSPADGRFALEMAGRYVGDVRASLLPLPSGERVVLRLLHMAMTPGLATLGMSAHQVSTTRSLLSKPGLTLISGPAGSGKTTTLYSALTELSRAGLHVMTLEDPVEREIDGLTQVAIDSSHGLSFDGAFRSSLRQDTDVIAIGEVRDVATAHTAVRAALTGRPVVASIHAEDAVGSLWRLVNLGIDPAVVGNVSCGLIAQRLVRRTCKNCSGSGCHTCGNTGFSGRTAVFEVVPVTPSLRRALEQRVSLADLRRIRSTMEFASLHDESIEQARRGITTMSEVSRLLTGDFRSNA